MTRSYTEFAVSIVTVLLFSMGLMQAFSYRGDSAYFPMFVFGSGAVCGIAWAAQSFLKIRKRSSQDVPEDEQDEVRIWNVVSIILASVLYVYAVGTFGYFVSTLVFVGVLPLVLGYRNPVAAIAGAVIFTAMIFLVFRIFLRVPLPADMLARLFGF